VANTTISVNVLDELIRGLDAAVQSDPAIARQMASIGRDESTDLSSRAAYGWALARAEHELGDVTASNEAYEIATIDAQKSGSDVLHARVLTSHALALAEGGDIAKALQSLADAQRMTPRVASQRILNQRCLVLMLAGQMRAAERAASAAITRGSTNRDDLTVLRATMNRGIIRLQRGNLRGADEDLWDARERAVALDQRLITCAIDHDLALVASRMGEITRALATFDSAEIGLGKLGSPIRTLTNLERDRAECLLNAGLAVEAAASSQRCEQLALTYDNHATAAEAALLAAQAERRCGRTAQALSAALRARMLFEQSGRPGWVAFTEFMELEASVELGRPWGDARQRSDLSARLVDFGWMLEAEQVRVLEIAIGAEDCADVGQLDRDQWAMLRRTGRSGPLSYRVRAWHTRALIHLANGSRRKASRVLADGVAALQALVTSIGDAEVHGGVAASTVELTNLGLRISLQDGDLTEALRWADRARHTASSMPRSLVADPSLVASLDALRTARSQLRVLEPGAAPFADAQRRVGQLEARIQRESRTRSQHPTPETSLDITTLAHSLVGTTLIEFARCDGTLIALTLDDSGTIHRCDIGPISATREQATILASSVRGIVHSPASSTVERTGDLARQLSDQFIVPLGELNSAVLIVVVPELSEVPWSSLPALENRTVTIAPSAQSWLSRGATCAAVLDQKVTDNASPSRRLVGLVAGPGLPGARREVVEIAARSDSILLVDEASSVHATLASNVSVLHVAAHGRLRSDQPELTALELADGLLTIHDLARVERLPEIVVLSACSLGGGPHVGDQTMSFAMALFDLGVGAVIAPLFAIPDEASFDLMTSFHRRLNAGESAPAALQGAQHDTRHLSPLAAMAAWSFQCTGRHRI
jgi:tetratricopeptide (TPR) repeat protein